MKTPKEIIAKLDGDAIYWEAKAAELTAKAQAARARINRMKHEAQEIIA